MRMEKERRKVLLRRLYRRLIVLSVFLLIFLYILMPILREQLSKHFVISNDDTSTVIFFSLSLFLLPFLITLLFIARFHSNLLLKIVLGFISVLGLFFWLFMFLFHFLFTFFGGIDFNTH